MKLQLQIDPPAWGLPSSSPQCLEALLYVQAAEVAYELELSPYPYSTITGALPCLKWNCDAVEASKCIDDLKQRFCDLDEHLAALELSDVCAYRALVTERLDAALTYLQWADQHNFSAVTRATYAKEVPFPVSTVLLTQARQKARQEMAMRGIHSVDQAVAIARGVYETLNHKLGSARLFSSTSRPCSLDVCVAARLAVHYAIPLPERPLKTMLDRDFPALVHHFQRVVHALNPEYKTSCAVSELEMPAEQKHDRPAFKSPKPLPRKLLKSEESERKLTPEEKETRRKLHNALALTSAAFVMFGFAAFYRRQVSSG